MPLFSIILPVYNGSKFVRKCIESIIVNTFSDFELIIVNDGSIDATASICDSYAIRDKRIVVYHNSNHGVSYSRNFGIDHAKGSWIGFIDADDWFASDALATIADSTKTDETDIVCYGFWSVTKENESSVQLPSIGQGKIPFMREQMLHGWTVVWNTFFKKDFLERYRLRFRKGITIGEDFEFIFRALYYANDIEVIDKQLYYYNRMNEDSVLHKMTVKHYDEIIEANLLIAQFFKENRILSEFKDIVAWKVLRAKQDYVLDIATHDKFLSIYPECHKYILSCPTINKKIKIMMWLLTHRLGWISRLIIVVRNSIKNNK